MNSAGHDGDERLQGVDHGGPVFFGGPVLGLGLLHDVPPNPLTRSRRQGDTYRAAFGSCVVEASGISLPMGPGVSLFSLRVNSIGYTQLRQRWWLHGL